MMQGVALALRGVHDHLHMLEILLVLQIVLLTANICNQSLALSFLLLALLVLLPDRQCSTRSTTRTTTGSAGRPRPPFRLLPFSSHSTHLSSTSMSHVLLIQRLCLSLIFTYLIKPMSNFISEVSRKMALLEDHVHICTTIEFSSIRIGDQLRSTVLYQITTSDKQTITACCI